MVPTAHDEAPFAREVARHLGTDHTELRLSPEAALELIPSLPDFYDEPFADSSQIPTYLVSEMARRHVLAAIVDHVVASGFERVVPARDVARIQRTQRAATATTIRVGSADVRVYSTHLGTFFEIGPGARQEQLRTILHDAERFTYAVIGGDMNDTRIGPAVWEHGFTWPTQYGPRTTLFGRLDHIFLKNLPVPDSAASGTVRETNGASDHSPVWVRGILKTR